MSVTSPRARIRRRVLLATAVAGSATLAISVTAPTAASAAASRTARPTTSHRMAPAVGVNPHFSRVSSPEQTAHGVVFGCQLTVPAGCYVPQTIRAAYGVDKLAARGLDGAGRTIVIVDAYSSPSLASDLGTFNSVFGLPAADLEQIAPDGRTPFDPNDPNQVGWQGEITLDVEWAHAIAPAAKIRLVLAKSNQDGDILSATKYAVDNNIGDVISQSFGEAEACMDPGLLAQQRRLFEQATAKGITLLASSGDQGAAQPTCDGTRFFKSASTPATDPNVTAVGGTRLFADGLTGAYKSESVWNEPAFAAAGGGGFSTVYGVPSYQQGNLHLPSRGVPDVSYNAAIIGGVIAVASLGNTGQSFYRFGGTSAGSPQWAGLVALADQLGGGRIGLMNPMLYAMAHSAKVYSNTIHDVTVGDDSYPAGGVTGFAATPGWDPASGLGSPKADQLVPSLVSRILG